jgi:hypothetical protein
LLNATPPQRGKYQPMLLGGKYEEGKEKRGKCDEKEERVSTGIRDN